MSDESSRLVLYGHPFSSYTWKALIALYEHKVKLLAAADAQPAELYETGDGRFEFERTISRLEEMRSEEYLAQGHGADEPLN